MISRTTPSEHTGSEGLSNPEILKISGIFEPSTYWFPQLRASCSTRLSYEPNAGTGTFAKLLHYSALYWISFDQTLKKFVSNPDIHTETGSLVFLKRFSFQAYTYYQSNLRSSRLCHPGLTKKNTVVNYKLFPKRTSLLSGPIEIKPTGIPK